MALLGNGVRIALQPLRLMGGGVAGDVVMWGRGERFNRMVGALPQIHGGTPNGELAPTAWTLPYKSGAIASRLRLLGDGEFASSVTDGRNLGAAITGDGDVTQAGLGLVVSLTCAIAGLSTVSPELVGKAVAGAALTGTGEVSAASLLAKANAVAALLGDGDVSGAVIRATGTLAAALNVTGATLTTANVADAVWGAVAEAGYTYDEVLRIVAAVVAGASSGGPGSPVFKALDGTTTRVEGTASSSGDRSAITYTP
jgi:hypothetical protein